MIELEVKHEGDGHFAVTSRQDWETAREEIAVGAVLKAEFKYPRSSPENRLLHGAIKSAYDNQRGGPAFSDEEGGWLKLRAWLLCETGHCNTDEFAPGSLSEAAVLTLKRRDVAQGIHSFWAMKRSSGQITCKTPRTIRFAVVKHSDFQPIKDVIARLLTEVICPGTTLDQLMGIRFDGKIIKRKRKEKAAAAEGELCQDNTR